jgi:hypothetical protein
MNSYNVERKNYQTVLLSCDIGKSIRSEPCPWGDAPETSEQSKIFL